MDNTPELDKALSELKKITGMTLEVRTDTPEELENAMTQIR